MTSIQTPRTETGDSAAAVSSSSSSSLPSVVEILDEPFIPVIPFGIALPTNKYPNPDNNESSNISSLIGENGIVGSITIMGKKSAMIWVGFGMLDLSSVAAMTSAATTNATTTETTTTSNSKTKNKSFSFGKGEWFSTQFW